MFSANDDDEDERTRGVWNRENAEKTVSITNCTEAGSRVFSSRRKCRKTEAAKLGMDEILVADHHTPKALINIYTVCYRRAPQKNRLLPTEPLSLLTWLLLSAVDVPPKNSANLYRSFLTGECPRLFFRLFYKHAGGYTQLKC